VDGLAGGFRREVAHQVVDEAADLSVKGPTKGVGPWLGVIRPNSTIIMNRS
jgi:hypothetical protein